MQKYKLKHYPESSILIESSPDANYTVHPVLKRVFEHRGIRDLADIQYDLPGLLSYEKLKGVSDAVDKLYEILLRQGKVLIVGDFDADGATSTAVAMRLLKQFGFQHVDYLVPDRFELGYGLTPELIDIATQYKPDLIVTVDNGISSIKGVIAANQVNIDVVVTDHHLAAEQLPDASAIVNPNQPGCQFESKCIAGVGVIFYVMSALRRKLRDENWFDGKQEPNLASILDLVALGTVADVVPLDRNNRIFVDYGIKRIRAGLACAGINALLEVANKKRSQISSTDLGFAVGPRLNAAGRLDDMSLGIECLITDDPVRAKEIAEELTALNSERRTIEKDMVAEAEKSLQQIKSFTDASTIPSAICICNDDWHQGVIGILASRVKEKYHRPVIAFADAGNNEFKGSARSIPGFHIRDALDLVDKQNPGIIHKFGGHAMAAGLSISRDRYDTFKSAFEGVADKLITEEQRQGVIMSDGELEAGHFTLSLAELLKFSSPWGQNFPEPVFDNVFAIKEWRIVGEHHLKLVLLSDNGQQLDAIAFNMTDKDLPAGTDSIRVAYTLDVNDFRNRKSLQLIIKHLEAA